MSELTLQKQTQIEVQIQVHNGVPATTSRNIAVVFEKRHDVVLRDIRNILASNEDTEFNLHNFVEISYTDDKGRVYPEFLLTRDGAMMLIMSYTGPKAMAIKTAYIKRFNEMEQLLKQRTIAPQLKLAISNYSLEDKVKSTAFILQIAGIKDNQLALALDKVVKAETGKSALKLTGVQLKAPQQEHLVTPTDLGKQVGLSAQKINMILEKAGLQCKDINDKWTPTEEGLALGAVLLDVNKAHSSGTPVRQLKWSMSVLDSIKQFINN